MRQSAEGEYQRLAETESDRLAQARRRVEAIKGFYIHLAVFVVVMLGLVVVDAATGERWWVHWVFFGWGIGILVHALAVFGQAPAFVEAWERRKIDELMRRR